MVYVDNMEAAYGRYKLCHMVADTAEELYVMANNIGVARKWVQYPDDPIRIHFDIALVKKRHAVLQFGAVPVTWRWVGERRRALRLGIEVPKIEVDAAYLEKVITKRGLGSKFT